MFPYEEGSAQQQWFLFLWFLFFNKMHKDLTIVKVCFLFFLCYVYCNVSWRLDYNVWTKRVVHASELKNNNFNLFEKVDIKWKIINGVEVKVSGWQQSRFCLHLLRLLCVARMLSFGILTGGLADWHFSNTPFSPPCGADRLCGEDRRKRRENDLFSKWAFCLAFSSIISERTTDIHKNTEYWERLSGKKAQNKTIIHTCRGGIHHYVDSNAPKEIQKI